MTNLESMVRFSCAVLIAGMRDLKALAVALGLPVFMLFTFRITTLDGSEESRELFEHMVPAICAMAVMMTGQTHAVRLVKWREIGTVRRLSLLPVPVSCTIIGVSISGAVIGVLQGTVLCLICFGFTGFPAGIHTILILPPVMLMTGTAFISLGSLLSGFMKRSHHTPYAFFAVFIPLFFISSFPIDELPASMRFIIPWLPTTMGIDLISGLFSSGSLSSRSVFPLTGLAVYSVLFSLSGALLFSRKNRPGGLSLPSPDTGSTGE